MLSLTSPDHIAIEDHISNGVETLQTISEFLERHIDLFKKSIHHEDLSLIKEFTVGSKYLTNAFENLQHDLQNPFWERFDFRGYIFNISKEIEGMVISPPVADGVSFIRIYRANNILKEAIHYLHSAESRSAGFFERWFFGKKR